MRRFLECIVASMASPPSYAAMATFSALDADDEDDDDDDDDDNDDGGGGGGAIAVLNFLLSEMGGRPTCIP